MAGRKTYHVTKTKDGWQGKAVGSKRALVTGKTKREVVEKTINTAKNQEKSSVKIHKGDGTIQEERTYPRKSDPHPPKG